MQPIYFFIAVAHLCFFHHAWAETASEDRVWTFKIIQTLKHPERPFTEGLQVIGNDVFESSGLYGESYLTRWSLAGDKPQIKKILSPKIFAEGMTILNKKGYLLTWQTQQGFVFDPDTLKITASFKYQGEGWGLTHDENSLIMSNGSAELRWLSPKDFKVEKKLVIKRNGKNVEKLNELEWVNGKIFANVWQSNEIVVINPVDGNVIASIDCTELEKSEANTPNVDVLNGIAYDRRNNTLLITGKYWESIYRIKIIEK